MRHLYRDRKKEGCTTCATLQVIMRRVHTREIQRSVSQLSQTAVPVSITQAIVQQVVKIMGYKRI